MRSEKIKVLVVDDSALIRSLLTEIINRTSDMVCVATAHDPLVARELIRNLNPDVITLDVEMPRMDGIEFLGRLMRLRPTPVVMISTLTQEGADVTLKALALGAVDFVTKPRWGVTAGVHELADQIVEKIRVAALATVRRLPDPTTLSPSVPRELMVANPLGRSAHETLVCIGSSTGGTEAVKVVLQDLPPDAPPVLIVQHMPPGFTSSFAKRLNQACRLTVKEASHGEHLLPGHAYVAPGGWQMRIERRGAQYLAMVEDTPAVNRHKPSVDVLFRSAAAQAGSNAIGIMLTGMGADGACAMREMREAGSYNYVQDEASCVVFGMPREAIAEGAAHEVLPLTQIAPRLLERLSAQDRQTA